MATEQDDEELMRELLCHFLASWPLKLAKSALRTLEALAFRQLSPIIGTVLDVGCGDGIFGRRIAPTADLWGVDNDLKRLQVAAKYRIHALAADAAALPFADQSLDVVIANSTLEHLANPQATIGEAERILRPGGRFVFTVPLRDGLDNLLFSKVRGAGYERQFNTYWRHVTMESIEAWENMVRSVPQFCQTNRLPIGSRRQTETIDLLSSVVLKAGPIIRRNRRLVDAQRLALASLVADLLARAAGCASTGEPHSEVLFEYVKHPHSSMKLCGNSSMLVPADDLPGTAAAISHSGPAAG